MELDEFQGSCGCTRIAGVTDPVSTNGNSRPIGVFLLGSNFTDNLGVCDVASPVDGDVTEFDRAKGVGSFHPLLSWIGLVAADSLAKAAKFVGVGGVPHLFVSGVPAKLAVLELFARCCVKDWTRKMDRGDCFGYSEWML